MSHTPKRTPPVSPHISPSSHAADGAGESPPQLTLRETAIDACSRKEHAVNRGYFRDPFLQCFVGDNTFVNSPLMNRGYWLRVKAVEHAIDRFCEMFPEDPIQIISLGAGYDTTYFRWAAAACGKRGNTAGTAAGADLVLPSCPGIGNFPRLHRYVEIDHGEVCNGKRDIILKQEGMNDLAHLKSDQEQENKAERDQHIHSNCVFRMVDCDLADPDALAQALLSPAKAQASCVIPNDHDSGHSCIDPTMPTLIIAECVLVYMTPEESTKLLASLLNSVFGNPEVPVCMVSYDAIGPDDRFGKVMVETLASRGIPLKGISSLKSTTEHENRAKAVGFNAVRSQTMKSLYLSVQLNDRKFLDTIEKIDDWDEWNLLHEHYSITFAGRLPKAVAERHDGKMPNLFLGITRDDEFQSSSSTSSAVAQDAAPAAVSKNE